MVEERTVNNTYELIHIEPEHEVFEHGIKIKAILADGIEQKFLIPNRLVNKVLEAPMPVKVHVESNILKLRTTGTFVRHTIKEVMT
jgi:hypothetical protein